MVDGIRSVVSKSKAGHRMGAHVIGSCDVDEAREQSQGQASEPRQHAGPWTRRNREPGKKQNLTHRSYVHDHAVAVGPAVPAHRERGRRDRDKYGGSAGPERDQKGQRQHTQSHRLRIVNPVVNRTCDCSASFLQNFSEASSSVSLDHQKNNRKQP